MTRIHPRALSRGFVPGICLAALLALAAAPAAAADDEVRGWVLSLDLALTQAGGLDQEYALQTNIFASPIPGRRHLIDNDPSATFRIRGGYNFGLDLGGLQVSYWGFDNDDRRADLMSDDVYPTLFGYGYSYYGSPAYLSSPYGVRTLAKSSVQASSLDVDYSRALDVGGNFTFRWLAGLRTVTFEEEVTFRGTVPDYYGYDYSISQKRHIDSTAFGVKVGGTGSFGFTKRFSLEGGAALSLLQARIKGDSRQTIASSDPYDPFSVSWRNYGKEDSGHGRILDLDLRGVWTEGPLSVFLGYSASSWEGLVRDSNPPRSPFYPLVAGRSRDSVSFSGFNVGVIYRFGARRLAAP